jgi:hypothetical protein
MLRGPLQAAQYGWRKPSWRLTFEDQWSVGPDEERNGPCTPCWPGSTFGIDGNVAGDDNGPAAVPRARLDPIDRIEEGRGPAIAGVLRVDAFDVVVAMEEVHEDGLGRLRLVDDGFCADIQPADLARMDVVFFHQARDHFFGASSRKLTTFERRRSPFSAKLLMSSRSSVKAMYSCPSPIVYCRTQH